jgi:23S rRNA (adenine2503-C2)-methyltransferase
LSDSTKTDLAALDRAGLEALLAELGEPKYRAGQIYRWIHRRGVTDVAQMTDLSKKLREKLTDRAFVGAMSIARVEKAADGTRKYALKTKKGDVVEAVFIPDASAEGRNTLCISSQVGCAIDCKFCLTASLGLLRNLEAHEIAEQITRVKEDLGTLVDPEAGPPIQNIVMMGMGEPLQNYANVVSALQMISSEECHNISARRITVSTSGLAPRIPRLGNDVAVNLAVSLNATTDAVRDRIMPINKKYNIEAVLDACRKFPMKHRQRITFEYVLLADENDSDDDARRLVKLLRGIPAKVNVIPFNEHPYSPFKRPPQERIDAFQRIVSDSGVPVFVRTPRGDDISAACGQLGAEVDAPRKMLKIVD